MPAPPEPQIHYRRVRVRLRRHRSRDRRDRSPDRVRHLILSVLLGACVGLLMALSFVRDYEQNISKAVVSCDAVPVKCPPASCSSDR
jgi:hypothetical protein